jgi:hypothetical protein
VRYLTPTQFAAAMDRKAKALQVNSRAALAATIAETQQEFVKASSGPLSTRQLAKMGHPYGRGMGAKIMRAVANIDPDTLNAQKGDFRKNWKKAGPRYRGGGYDGSVVNTTMFGHWTAAQIFLGTNRMIPRRIDQAVVRKMRPKFRMRQRAALRKALRA